MSKKQRIAELEKLVDALRQQIGRLENRIYILEARTPAEPLVPYSPSRPQPYTPYRDGTGTPPDEYPYKVCAKA